MALDPSRLPAFIKEIGRGRNAARDLSREDAQTLFSAMLFGEVPDLQLGGILVALRIKGESMEELAGFMAACEGSYEHLPAPRATPVVIPSYNGARQLPNLVPLLAMLLARAGIPALVHGVMRDPGRVSTREVFEALGVAPAASIDETSAQLDERRFAFMPVERLAPRVTSLLDLRASLGVRNSAHTLVKMLQPFSAPALRIVSVTHPEYVLRMREFYTRHDTGALILRGAEGEAVAHPRREPSIDWAHGGKVQTWTSEAAPPADLPSRNAAETARWIERVLAGEIAVPAAIAHQIECVQRALKEMR
ncbi:MAG TPA: DNA-binding protein YbiB [Burkholderiales bacterium]|nr:DNA-binding protein YbiB [Burkholderiales bacterium]